MKTAQAAAAIITAATVAAATARREGTFQAPARARAHTSDTIGGMQAVAHTVTDTPTDTDTPMRVGLALSRGRTLTLVVAPHHTPVLIRALARVRAATRAERLRR